MKIELTKLLEAQKNDLEIDELDRNKKEYPQQRENLLKEIKSTENTLENIKASILEKEKNRRMIENEIKNEREALKRKDNRLLETKTNKEYTAVQHEIVIIRERIDSLETEDLKLMTELDELVPQKEELEKKLQEIQNNNTIKIDEIKKKFESIETDIKKLERKREKSLEGVNSRTLSIYNRLRKGKGGIAVSTVDPVKHSCKGCYKQLPPQKVLEIRRGEKIIFCENCGRILVWGERNEE